MSLHIESELKAEIHKLREERNFWRMAAIGASRKLDSYERAIREHQKRTDGLAMLMEQPGYIHIIDEDLYNSL